MTLDGLIAKLKKNTNAVVYGLCDFTWYSNNGENEKGLRLVDSGDRWDIIQYDGRNFIAFVLEDSFKWTNGESRNAVVTLVSVCNDWHFFDNVVSCFNKYDIKEFEGDRRSIEVYERYFGEIADKPFNGYAFTIKIEVELSKKC